MKFILFFSFFFTYTLTASEFILQFEDKTKIVVTADFVRQSQTLHSFLQSANPFIKIDAKNYDAVAIQLLLKAIEHPDIMKSSCLEQTIPVLIALEELKINIGDKKALFYKFVAQKSLSESASPIMQKLLMEVYPQIGLGIATQVMRSNPIMGLCSPSMGEEDQTEKFIMMQSFMAAAEECIFKK